MIRKFFKILRRSPLFLLSSLATRSTKESTFIGLTVARSPGRVPAKNCHKQKLPCSIIRVYLLLGLIKLWGGHFVKIFWSSWNVHVIQERSLVFAARKRRRSWNIWTSNANRAKDIFSSCSIRFTTLRMSEAKNFAGDKRKAWVEIRFPFYAFRSSLTKKSSDIVCCPSFQLTIDLFH